MKAKVFFFLCLMLSVVSCGSDDDGGSVNQPMSVSALFGHWTVEQVMVNQTWNSAQSAGLDGELIFTEDGYMSAFGRGGWDEYTYKDGNVLTYQYYGDFYSSFRFTNYDGMTADVHYVKVKSGGEYDLKVRQGSQDDVLCKDPMRFLEGVWDVDGGGSVEFVYDRPGGTAIIATDGASTKYYCKRSTDFINYFYIVNPSGGVPYLIYLQDFATDTRTLYIHHNTPIGGTAFRCMKR